MEVSVENLTKSYGFQKAVDNISFKVNTGEIVGFLGPNGAGKTTTMKIITCYMGPDEGDVKIGGISVQAHPEEVKRHIGYLPETNPLYKEMPVIDYLQFVADIQQVPKAKIRDRIFEIVSICGLKSEKYKKISELSKGFQQRAGLAQALIHDPEVLILDEPTSGLDPSSEVTVCALVSGTLSGNQNSRMIVISDGDFPINGVGQQAHQIPTDNLNLIVNSIDWLSDDTGLIDLRTKEVTSRPIDQMDDGKKTFLKYLNFLLPVFLIIGFGIFRYQSRRNLRARRMNENYF